MILAHILDAWTDPAVRSTPAFRGLRVLGGFAAPLFLWLAGVAVALAGERALGMARSRREASQQLVRRGLEIFILAFVFRVQSWLFNPGGPPIMIFRVDILNIMGLAMAVAGALWGLTRSRGRQVVLFAAIAAATAMLTPVVQSAAWVDGLPIWLQWYVRPAGEHTLFTWFPWAGFVFAGTAVGVLLASAVDGRAEHRLHLILGLCGSVLVALGFYTASLPSIYRQASFWTSSPTFFAIRAGVMLLAASAIYAGAVAAGRWRLALGPLQRLGRASLFLYWVHVQIVYGWVTSPLRHHLEVWQTLVAFAVFSLMTYALIPLRDAILEAWQAPGPERETPQTVA